MMFGSGGLRAWLFAFVVVCTGLALAPAAFAANTIFWTNYVNSTISYANLDGTGSGGQLFTGTTPAHPQGLALDPAANKIYWADFSNGTISYASLDGTGGGGQLSTAGATVSGPAGVAIDPAANKIYWTNTTNSTISFANLDGTGAGGQLKTTGATVASPVGVAIDPASNKIYWANNGNSTISFANLDGTGAGGQLKATGAPVSSPTGVAVDPTSNKIYWANTAAISFANLDGTGGGQLKTTGAPLADPVGVAIDPGANKIYWANVFNSTISFANLDGTGGGGQLITTGATPSGPNYPALLESPSAGGAPAIAGGSSPGATLSCSGGTWAPDLLGSFLFRAPRSLAYAWTRNGVPIAGASTSSITASATGAYTCTVTAINQAGSSMQSSAPFTVSTPPPPPPPPVPPPPSPPLRPVNTVPPAITGTAKAGSILVCGPGSWTGSPTVYLYQWSRDGTPIAGATGSPYDVQKIDEGNTLTCAAAGVNIAGIGVPATSGGVLVSVPHVARCPAATGLISGAKVGLVKLGDTREQAQAAYKHSSGRGTRYEEFFCLTPIGIRVGYASPKALAKLSAAKRTALEGRVIWISTSSAYYAIEGIRPGATIAAAAKKLKVGKVFHIGRNDWYLARTGSVTAILKVRHSLVQEIGIAEEQLTQGRSAERTFLTSFS